VVSAALAPVQQQRRARRQGADVSGVEDLLAA